MFHAGDEPRAVELDVVVAIAEDGAAFLSFDGAARFGNCFEEAVAAVQGAIASGRLWVRHSCRRASSSAACASPVRVERCIVAGAIGSAMAARPQR